MPECERIKEKFFSIFSNWKKKKTDGIYCVDKLRNYFVEYSLALRRYNDNTQMIKRTFVLRLLWWCIIHALYTIRGEGRPQEGEWFPVFVSRRRCDPTRFINSYMNSAYVKLIRNLSSQGKYAIYVSMSFLSNY